MTDEPRDRRTDRPTKLGTEAPSPELKKYRGREKDTGGKRRKGNIKNTEAKLGK